MKPYEPITTGTSSPAPPSNGVPSIETTNEIGAASGEALRASLGVFDGIADPCLEIAAERLDPLKHLADLREHHLDRQQIALRVEPCGLKVGRDPR